MTTRKAKSTSDKPKGLERATREAVNPTMKRLGELALAQGFSQETLAKELNRLFGLRFNGANVYANITVSRPQRHTIERYAEILGLDSDQLHVVEHDVLAPNRAQHWEREVFRMLETFKTDFEPDVIQAVESALKADSAVRARALAAAAMPPKALVQPEWSEVPFPLVSFAQSLLPRLDLRKFTSKRPFQDAVLFLIYGPIKSIYRNDDKALAFVDVCARILQFDGIETRKMSDYLNQKLQEISISSIALGGST